LRETFFAVAWGMASWDDVRRIALALPEAAESASSGGQATWRVRGKLFAWERPLRDSELEALGKEAPSGPILAARVEHLHAKEAILTDEPRVYFTTPHFDGHSSILVPLERVDLEQLEELIVEAWLARAPKRAAKAYLEELDDRRR
jgi:hypothetical protein